jgi:hypothetical protein
MRIHALVRNILILSVRTIDSLSKRDICFRKSKGDNSCADTATEQNVPAVKKTKLLTCQQCNETLSIIVSLTDIWKVIQVKNHTVAHCVANRLHKATTLNSIWEFIQVKSHTVAHCVTNPFHRAVPLISIQTSTEAKNHSVAHCVANRFHRASILNCIWESTQVKNHTVAHCVTNRLQQVIYFIDIREFTQAKSHSAALCVTNHLHRPSILIGIWEFTQPHSEKPYSCTLCDKSFSERRGLTGHHRRIHAEEVGVNANSSVELNSSVVKWRQ